MCSLDGKLLYIISNLEKPIMLCVTKHETFLKAVLKQNVHNTFNDYTFLLCTVLLSL